MSNPADVPMRDAPRVTPWELIFGPAVFDVARFEEVRTQAESAAASSAEELFMLPAAGELLRSLRPPEGGREVVEQLAAMIHAAYRFWLHGCTVYRIADADFGAVLESGTGASSFPVPAGYVQLPRNVMWARVDEESAAEPVDGFFWNVPDAGAAVELLFALGIRPGRPGLSLFDMRLEGAAQLEPWARAQARPEGDDFANVLPGGELQGYRALTTGGEALKLAALCAAYVASGEWTVSQHAGQRIHVRTDG